jgi:hypothetical protein
LDVERIPRMVNIGKNSPCGELIPCERFYHAK